MTIDNISEIIVFEFNPSPKNIQVQAAMMIIPVPNAINLPGHKRPSKPSQAYFVEIMIRYEIGTPNRDTKRGCSFMQDDKNCPLT